MTGDKVKLKQPSYWVGRQNKIKKGKTMLNKIKEVLGSLRFWIVTLGFVIAELTQVQKAGFNLIDLLNFIQGWLGSVVALGTFDSIAQNISGTKKQ